MTEHNWIWLEVFALGFRIFCPNPCYREGGGYRLCWPHDLSLLLLSIGYLPFTVITPNTMLIVKANRTFGCVHLCGASRDHITHKNDVHTAHILQCRNCFCLRKKPTFELTFVHWWTQVKCVDCGIAESEDVNHIQKYRWNTDSLLYYFYLKWFVT